MANRKGRGTAVVGWVMEKICLEFAVTRRDLRGGSGEKENFLQLMAIGVAREASGLGVREIARLFRVPPRRVREAPKRIGKYRRHLPGFRAAYKRLRRQASKYNPQDKVCK